MRKLNELQKNKYKDELDRLVNQRQALKAYGNMSQAEK